MNIKVNWTRSFPNFTFCAFIFDLICELLIDSVQQICVKIRSAGKNPNKHWILIFWSWYFPLGLSIIFLFLLLILYRIELKDNMFSFWLEMNVDSRGLRKQPTFGDSNTGFPAKWSLRSERRNSILMMHHYPALGSASDWLNQISHAAWPIRKHYPDLGSDVSSVWNYHIYFSDVIWRGNYLVVESPNVSCFLRLWFPRTFFVACHVNEVCQVWSSLKKY